MRKHAEKSARTQPLTKWPGLGTHTRTHARTHAACTDAGYLSARTRARARTLWVAKPSALSTRTSQRMSSSAASSEAEYCCCCRAMLCVRVYVRGVRGVRPYRPPSPALGTMATLHAAFGVNAAASSADANSSNLRFTTCTRETTNALFMNRTLVQGSWCTGQLVCPFRILFLRVVGNACQWRDGNCRARQIAAGRPKDR